MFRHNLKNSFKPYFTSMSKIRWFIPPLGVRGLIILIFLWIGFSKDLYKLNAQPTRLEKLYDMRRTEVEKLKKDMIFSRINLQETQIKAFSEMYDAYLKEKLVMRRKLQKTRKNAQSLANTDADLKKNIDELFSFRQEDLNMEKLYKDKFLTILNIRQLAELYRSEQDFIQTLLKTLRNNLPLNKEED